MPSIRLVEIHPILVHFPIALLIISVLFDFLSFFLRRAHLVEAATWCLGLGALGLLASELSGNIVEGHVNRAVLPLTMVDNSDFSPTRLTALRTRLILPSQGVLLSPHFK